MHPLTTIICGKPRLTGAYGEVHTHLADTLDKLFVRAKKLIDDGDETDLALFAPTLGRSTIEVAFTAILSRFDPFRILAIRRSQKNPSYLVQMRNPIAFNWVGDVKGEEKPKEWGSEGFSLKDLQRSLLGKHYGDLFLEEAFTNMLDSTPPLKGGVWMDALRKISPDAFVTYSRGQADQLYSELSKGIHHEFVVPMVVKYDPVTVNDLLGRVWELVGSLGIVTCHSPLVNPIPANEIIDLYEEAQSEFSLS